VHDEAVRKSWQLEPSQFTIENPGWNESLQAFITQTIKPGLGIVSHAVSCTLYKLLLYEEGGHFKPHKDTEKEERMFGTLIIQLPSCYSGGDVVISHNGTQSRFAFAKEAPFHAYYTAFYADCKHEIEPVTNGHRLCLIYNLVYTRGTGMPPIASRTKHLSSLRKTCAKWVRNYDNYPSKLIYILEHQYSTHGLKFKNLKGQDALIADLMLHANKEGIFKVFLAMLEKHENGHGSNGYREENVMEDELETDYKLEEMIDIDDNALRIATTQVEESEIFPEDRLEDLEETRSEREAPTGNAGAFLDKWYKSAVLWFYPMAKEEDVTDELGIKYPKNRYQKKEKLQQISVQPEPPKKKQKVTNVIEID
jgi:hypothetical protein